MDSIASTLSPLIILNPPITKNRKPPPAAPEADFLLPDLHYPLFLVYHYFSSQANNFSIFLHSLPSSGKKLECSENCIYDSTAVKKNNNPLINELYIQPQFQSGSISPFFLAPFSIKIGRIAIIAPANVPEK